MPNGPVRVVPDQKYVFPSEQEMFGALAVIITPCFVIIVVQPVMFFPFCMVRMFSGWSRTRSSPFRKIQNSYKPGKVGLLVRAFRGRLRLCLYLWLGLRFRFRSFFGHKARAIFLCFGLRNLNVICFPCWQRESWSVVKPLMTGSHKHPFMD